MGTDALYHSHRKEHMTQEVQLLKICQLKAEAASLESIKKSNTHVWKEESNTHIWKIEEKANYKPDKDFKSQIGKFSIYFMHWWSGKVALLW